MQERPPNAFIRALQAPTYDTLTEHLTQVNIPLGEVLCKPGDKVDMVYFPMTCVLSLLTTSLDGDTVESAMVGNEGALGLLETFGSGQAAMRTLCQIDGAALRAPAAVVKRIAVAHPDITDTAWRLLELQVIEARQSGMCQALHPVEKRFCRWLVESTERGAGRNPMPLTQEFIAAMLGVQRTTVTAFATQLQKHGLIRYQRGRVELVDLDGLRGRACECHDITSEHRRRLGFQPIPDAGKLRIIHSA